MADITFSKLPGRRSKYPGAEEIIKEYETAPASKLAMKYGVAQGTIRSWLRKARKEVADGTAR